MWAAVSITGLGTKMPHSVQFDQRKKKRKEEKKKKIEWGWLELVKIVPVQYGT